ncbi:hypothetical protein [Moorena bouillonii]|uniref:hypothetical protein n=1 Tax=Moorena bouillonii TaxID=207920 RepID=UPI0011811E24|nr:hypothetical protein [Moorena bouillonii]
MRLIFEPRYANALSFLNKLLAGILIKGKHSKKKSSPGQISFMESLCQVSENPQVQEVAEKFVRANSFNPSQFC